MDYGENLSLTQDTIFFQLIVDFISSRALAMLSTSKGRRTGLAFLTEVCLDPSSANTNFQSNFFTLHIDQHTLNSIRLQRKPRTGDSENHNFTLENSHSSPLSSHSFIKHYCTGKIFAVTLTSLHITCKTKTI